ncbi:unnamed protein product [Closterium sp. NIES-53]
MYALSISAEGDYYRCVPPDPGIAAAALGTSASSTPPGTTPAEALHTFMLDSGTLRCFFRDSTTLTPLPAPVPVRLADPSGGPVVACSSTNLPCPAVASGSFSGLHITSFSTNMVSTAALQDAMVTTTTPGGSSLYTLATEPPQVTASAQVSTSGQVAASCSCRLLTHQTLLWHHRLGHPSLPHLRGMHSRLLVSSLPRYLPPLPPSPTPPYLPCVEGRQRAAPHSSSFPSTTAPLQTLHMDVWGPARVSGQGRERYFLLVEEDYTRYTTVSPLCSKGEVSDVLIPWIRTVRLQLRERFGQDLSRLHSGSRAFVRDTSADKLSARAIPCVFLGFAPDAPGWQFYHPTSRRVFPSQDVTFDESVPFYRLFPYHSAPPPPPPLFLAPGPPPVDPLQPQGPAPSGVSQVDPLPVGAPIQVAVVSGAAPGAVSGGAASRGAASGGAEPGGAGSEGAGSGGAEPEGVERRGVESEGAESGGAEPRGAASSGGPAGASPRLSSQQLREWLVRRPHRRSRAPRAGGAGDTGAGAAAVPTGAVGTSGVGCAGAEDPTEPGAARAVGAGAGVAGDGSPEAGAVDPGAGGTDDTVRPRPYFVPLLQQPASALPPPSPYTKQSSGLTERGEPASCPVSPVRMARRAPRSRPRSVRGTHTMAHRPSSVPLRVPLPAPSESYLAQVPDPESDQTLAASPTVACLRATAVTDPSFDSAAAFALVAELLDFAASCRLEYATALVAESVSASPPSVEGECALGTDVLEDRQEDFEYLATAEPRFASMLLAPEGDPDAPDIPTLRSYAEAIMGPYPSHWQAAIDAEMASWKSTCTYVQEGVDYFQTFSPTPKMTTLRVLLHDAALCDYELHSLDFSTAFLQGSLHNDIWLRRQPGFTGTFPAADPSLFLRTDPSLFPIYILVYVDDLVFATADTEALTLVKSE